MDGLRKVPQNIPNQNLIKENLDKPLSSIPDPFGKFKSFSDHNNNMLIDFLKDLILILNSNLQLNNINQEVLTMA